MCIVHALSDFSVIELQLADVSIAYEVHNNNINYFMFSFEGLYRK